MGEYTKKLRVNKQGLLLVEFYFFFFISSLKEGIIFLWPHKVSVQDFDFCFQLYMKHYELKNSGKMSKINRCLSDILAFFSKGFFRRVYMRFQSFNIIQNFIALTGRKIYVWFLFQMEFFNYHSTWSGQVWTY